MVTDGLGSEGHSSNLSLKVETGSLALADAPEDWLTS